jgi:16S rRNA (cytosine1402-N4)-methyltransferase
MRTRRSASSSSDPVSSSPHGKQGFGVHHAVLLHEVLHWLDIQANDVILDATLGGGGHAQALVEKLGSDGTFVGVDADASAVERVREKLQGAKARVHLVNANFRDLAQNLREHNVPKLTKALFDLGWSGYQLTAGRGFSFLQDEPLIMTYAEKPTSDALTARVIVNTWKEESIADVLYGWGEERYSRRIARRIVEERAKKPIETSRQLADIVASAVPGAYKRGKLHPATRTFQALRIAVNDEFGALRAGLRAAWDALEEGGRIAVISFHSVEDREVKNLMREWEKEGVAQRLVKSPIVAQGDEMHANPRSRSAKLRVLEKLSNIHHEANSYNGGNDASD